MLRVPRILCQIENQNHPMHAKLGFVIVHHMQCFMTKEDLELVSKPVKV